MMAWRRGYNRAMLTSSVFSLKDWWRVLAVWWDFLIESP